MAGELHRSHMFGLWIQNALTRPSYRSNSEAPPVRIRLCRPWFIQKDTTGTWNELAPRTRTLDECNSTDVSRNWKLGKTFKSFLGSRWSTGQLAWPVHRTSRLVKTRALPWSCQDALITGCPQRFEIERYGVGFENRYWGTCRRLKMWLFSREIWQSRLMIMIFE